MDISKIIEALRSLDFIVMVVFILAILLGVFIWRHGGDFLRLIQDSKKQKRLSPEQQEQEMKQGISEISDMFELCTNFQHQCKAGRLMLLTFHNGGGYPDGSNKCAIDVPYEVVDYPNELIRHKLQNFKGFDQHYVSMLTTLHDPSKRGIFYIVDQMPECFLKSTFKANGIACAYVRYITVLGNDLWYLSMQWNKPEKGEYFDTNLYEFKNNLTLFINQVIDRITPKDRDIVKARKIAREHLKKYPKIDYDQQEKIYDDLEFLTYLRPEI